MWPVVVFSPTSQVLETCLLECGVDGTSKGEEACGGNLVLYSELAEAYFLSWFLSRAKQLVITWLEL